MDELQLATTISHSDLLEAALHRWEQKVTQEAATCDEEYKEAERDVENLCETYSWELSEVVALKGLSVEGLEIQVWPYVTNGVCARLGRDDYNKGLRHFPCSFRYAYEHPDMELQVEGTHQNITVKCPLTPEEIHNTMGDEFFKKMETAVARLDVAYKAKREADRVLYNKDNERKRMRGEFLARLVETRAPSLAALLGSAGAPMLLTTTD